MLALYFVSELSITESLCHCRKLFMIVPSVNFHVVYHSVFTENTADWIESEPAELISHTGLGLLQNNMWLCGSN